MLDPGCVPFRLCLPLVILELVRISFTVLLIQRVERQGDLIVGLAVFHEVVEGLRSQQEKIVEQVLIRDVVKQLRVDLDNFETLHDTSLDRLHG